ncbi:hypothetical protein [Ectobacillus funiculus]|uniref:hypothetical protein n=1 Tax=Ectobacillus funiculus TaxID=137993 RepID=UPI0013EAF222|nr:hypothetical protein [Ectobacillus funiculus]
MELLISILVLFLFPLFMFIWVKATTKDDCCNNGVRCKKRKVKKWDIKKLKD